MTTIPLSLEGFQDLLDRRGGDLASWPVPDATAAAALLDSSPEAREMLDAARSLDAGLAATAKAPKGLADRIIAAALDANTDTDKH